MSKKARPKMPVSDGHRCEMIDGKGKRCPRRRAYHFKALDSHVTDLCATCAYKLRDQIQAHPDYFEARRFVAINKFTPS